VSEFERAAGSASGRAAFGVDTDWPSPGTAVVTPAGELDLGNAEELRAKLLDALEQGADLVVVDLESATFVESTILSILLDVARRLQRLGGDMRIACAEPNITRILEITLLDRVLCVFPSLEAALA
jgi:anti-sigma B factor antagonist